MLLRRVGTRQSFGEDKEGNMEERMESREERRASLSRRGFLAGAAASVAAVASAGALAGCGQGKSADDTASAGSGGSSPTVGGASSEDNVADIPPVGVPASWDEEYDVVVVGSGGGLFGAVRAAELGAKVCCVEKSASVGGASKESSIFACSGTKVQLAAGLPDISLLIDPGVFGQAGAGSGQREEHRQHRNERHAHHGLGVRFGVGTGADDHGRPAGRHDRRLACG